MAAILVYADLVAALPEWANRANDAEYLARVPEFIQQGELRLFRKLRWAGNEKYAYYPIEGEDATDNRHGITIPNDFLEAKWLLYGDQPLERISEQRYFQLSTDVTPRPPRYFARVTDSFFFYPHADTNKDVRLGYYEFQGPLSEALTFTKMFRIAPMLYLYAALIEGARFCRDQAGLQMWTESFDRELDEILAQGADNEADGSTIAVTAGANSDC